MSKQYSRGVTALAIAAWAVSAGLAHAAPVRHDNLPGPGHYEWGDEAEAPNWLLNITLSAAAQGGLLAAPSVFFHTNTGPESQVGAVWSGDALQVGGDFGVFALGFNADELIPTPNAWDGVGYVAVDGFGSALPEGQQVYLAVSIDLGDGDHYGWIGVVREGHDLDAFAWGYETEIGVPIAAGAPEPGTLALLVFGAVSVVARRKR